MPNDIGRKFSAAAGARERLAWAGSKTIGQVTEIAVLAPIKKGCPLGERRTYEERMRAAIASVDDRHRRGLPTELSRVSSIHFGRIIILRPEQYLVGSSNLTGVAYHPEDDHRDGANTPRDDADYVEKIPQPIDDFFEIPPSNGTIQVQDSTPEFRSWALTLVEFDGDLKVYFRDIAKFLAKDFDEIFDNCENFPTTREFEPFWQWIRRYQISTALFYASYGDLSVARLKQLETFKLRFDAFVAQVRSPQGRKVGAMDELFDVFLRENTQYGRGFPSPSGLFPSTDDKAGA